MIMWESPLLAIIRNFISIAGFSLLYLSLDQPKYTWRKSIIYHILFIIVFSIVGTIWMLKNPTSYIKYFTFTIFVGAVLVFPRLSQDTRLQSLYNISVQIFIHILQLVFGIGLSKMLFNSSPWAEVILMSLYLIFVILIYLRFFRKFYREIAIALRNRWHSFSIISVIGCLVLVSFWTRPTFLMVRPLLDQVLYLGVWSLFFMTHLMMLKNMLALYREMTTNKNLALIEMNIQQFNYQIAMQAESIEEAHRIRHDLRHHNKLVAEFAQNDDLQGLLQYLGEYEKILDTNQTIDICENIVANNILNVYLKKAKQNEIDIQMDVSLGRDISISDIDLVAILANLMENAINGCIQSGQSNLFIILQIKRKASKLVIYIRNSARDNIRFENNIPKSESHEGIGIASILHSTKRYGGEYDFQLKDGVFSCQILLKDSYITVKKYRD